MIVEYPLTKANRIRLARAFRRVQRVDLSIDCVTENQMGRVLVDDVDQPAVFNIQTGIFSYFAGDPSKPSGQEMIDAISPYTLLMPSSPGWIEVIRKTFGEKLGVMDRYSFSSKALSSEHVDRLCSLSPYHRNVQKMDGTFAAHFWGQDHFIDLSNYDSVEDFIQRGAGYAIEDGGKVAGTAYASLVCSQGIEISIYVEEEYRRRGMATVLAAYLIGWCLEHDLDPHWDAANPESCKLALKLGYKFTGTYPAYYTF